MEKHSCDCCVNEPDDRNMPRWDAGEPKRVRVGCLIRPGRTRPWLLHGVGASVLCHEPGAKLPGFMKSQSHVICRISKEPLVTEGAAGLCCDRAKGMLRKVSELGRGTAGREQKIPEWGSKGPGGCPGETPSGEGAWSPDRTQPLGMGRKARQGGQVLSG